MRSVARLLVAVVAVAGALTTPLSTVGAQTAADPSDVVVVLDYSASILKDKPNRDRFAAALEEIAARVAETRDDLVTGDVTISFVVFATSARGFPGCERLELRDSLEHVDEFSDCLRRLAAQYRRGLEAPISEDVGIHTNYVAALRAAAEYLPDQATRPAVVFFTDGQHDVSGVPASRVLPEARRLFGARSPFALLPVGMGLDSKSRPTLERGLERLRDLTRDMHPCPGGAEFRWETVVFASALDAGHAVATALEQVTCTFTVAPRPTPTPAVPPGAARDVGLAAGDGFIEVSWTEPDVAGTAPIGGYRIRCREAGTDAWAHQREVEATESSAAFDGIENGTEYECEVAAFSAAGTSDWARSGGTATPARPPAAPLSVRVDAGDRSAVATVTVGDTGGSAITDYRYECTTDGGATWTSVSDAVSSEPVAHLEGLANGTEYACRSYAQNALGSSPASPSSNPFRPCGDPFECNPLLRWVALAIMAAAILALLSLLLAWYRGRTRQFITAQVDEAGTIDLGRGPDAGMSFVAREVQADRRRSADVRIRYRGGGRFEVTTPDGRNVPVREGEAVEFVDGEGEPRRFILRAHARRPRPSRPSFESEDTDWETTAEPGSPFGGSGTRVIDDWD